MKIIFDYNRTIFDPEANKLYEGAFALLQKLSQNYELFLVSLNEPGRRNKIKEFGIAEFFQRIEFVEKKSEELFIELVGKKGKVIVVGDSLRNEIKIANALGFISVRVKQGKFSEQNPRDTSEIADHEITNLNELEKIIKTYE